MKTIKEIIRHAIDYEDNQFKKAKYITESIIGEKYFVVLEDDTILESNYDSILDRSNIKLAFAFLKVAYQPTDFDESYLSPIIIGKDHLSMKRKMEINDWIFDFKGQDILKEAEPVHLTISNSRLDVNISKKLSVERPIPTDQTDFKIACQLCLALSECTSKESVQLVIDQFSKEPVTIKEGLIDQMQKEIIQLKADLEDKVQTIEDYKNRLDSIKGIVRT